MSLEAALAANTAAFTANTAMLGKVAELLAEGNKVRTDLLTSAAAVTTPRKPRDKPAATTEPAKPAAAVTAPAATTSATGSPTLDAIMKEFGGAISVENIRTEFGGYLGVTDEAERAERRKNVMAILAQVQVAKTIEMKEEDRARAIHWLRQFAAGQAVNFKADIDAPAPAAKAEPEAEGDDLL